MKRVWVAGFKGIELPQRTLGKCGDSPRTSPTIRPELVSEELLGSVFRIRETGRNPEEVKALSFGVATRGMSKRREEP